MKLLAFVMVACNLFWQRHSSCKNFERMKSGSESHSALSNSLGPHEFSRPEYCSGWHFPSPGDLPNPGIEPRSPALQADSLPAEPQEKPLRGYLEKLKVAVSLDCAERKEHILRGATEIYEHRGSQVWVCVLGRSGVHEHDADVGADGVKCHMLSFKH